MPRCLRPALAAAIAVAGAPRDARALDPTKAISQYNMRAWSVDAGLPHASVTAVAQTPDGHLWVGTDAGLARFDGVAFTVFAPEQTPGLAARRIRTLLVDGAGVLWIGSQDGPGLTRHRDGRFEAYAIEGAPRPVAVGAAFEDHHGRLWFGASSAAGAIRIAGGKLTLFPLIDRVALGPVDSIAEDRQGTLWFGSPKGIAQFRDGTMRWLTRTAAPEFVPIRAIVPDPDGSVWMGTEKGLLFKRGDLSRQFTTADGLAHDQVTALLRDRDGVLWIGTQRGLSRYHAGKIDTRAAGGGVLDDAISTLLEDREHNLWLGTRNGGLVRLNEGAFTSLPLEPLAGRVGVSIYGRSDGSIWIGTLGGGLVRYADRALTPYTQKTGLCTDHVLAMAEDAGGRLWVGGTHGPRSNLCVLDGGSFRALGPAEGLERYEFIRALHRDRAGTLWVGAGHGLYRFEGGRLVRIEGHERIFSLHEDRRGGLWVGGEGVLDRRRDERWESLIDDRGLSARHVHAITESDDGALWIATSEGFTRFRNGRFTPFKAAQGLTDDPVFKVLDDGNGFLWLCSTRGVLRVRKPEGDRIETPFMRYGASDGLKSDQCEGGQGHAAGWRAADGRLWFATSRGAAFLDPRGIARESRPPQPAIERVLLDGRPSEPAGGVTAPPGRGEVEVAYASLTLTAPERLRFRYRLDPFDPQWIDAGARRSAHYTNLPPGRYQFLVNARHENGPWSAATSMELRLLPRATQTWWFKLLAVALLVAAGVTAAGLVHRQRVRRLRLQHEAVLAERQRLARELHDTLAQGFTGISLQLESAASRLPESATAARENLEQARALAKASLADARRAVWDLRLQALERGDVAAALSEIARAMSPARPVRVQVNGGVRRLPPDQELALLRSGQEALTNALKHAGAGKITVDVSFADGGVEVRVADDGSGLAPDRPGASEGHFGLAGIRERLAPMGGTLTVSSRPGAGTEVKIFVPRRGVA